jgi:Na+/H+ antiporter NhaA
MSIFIAYAAFEDPRTLELAKLSTILASVAAATFGYILLRGQMPGSHAEARNPLDVSPIEGVRTH